LTLLSGRVLDLTGEEGFLCGRILADLGAEVIKVEKPGGDDARNIQPFYHGIPHPEKSLYWFAHNLNKKGITLDIATADGREIFKRLVSGADFVIESFPVGYMDGLGLGYPTLKSINPSIILTSITPFGQQGPYQDYKASDITSLAMGGLLYITGYQDRPPLRISFPQASLLGASSAASATMVAHHHRQNTGEGQHVDVSIQASVTWVITNTIAHWELDRINLSRQGSVLSSRFGNNNQRIIWRCQDGFVAYVIFGGRLGVSMGNCQLAGWMEEEGIADDFLKNFEWENYDLAVATQEMQNRLESYAEKLFLRYTKLQLYEEGLKRDIKIFPVYSPKDLLRDPQLQSRDFWVQVAHPELNETLTYPGTFFRTSEQTAQTPLKPPLIGEHNQEIYRQLGISGEEMIRLKQAGVI
jgi:crotonobetainyl-CoA:carnitine CoA-transferase CaiB-like acyl-CoA transferase